MISPGMSRRVDRSQLARGSFDSSPSAGNVGGGVRPGPAPPLESRHHIGGVRGTRCSHRRGRVGHALVPVLGPATARCQQHRRRPRRHEASARGLEKPIPSSRRLGPWHLECAPMTRSGLRRIRRRQPLLRGHRRLHPPRRPQDAQALHAMGHRGWARAAAGGRFGSTASSPTPPSIRWRDRAAWTITSGERSRPPTCARPSANSSPSRPLTATATPASSCWIRRACRRASCSPRWAWAWRPPSSTTRPL